MSYRLPAEIKEFQAIHGLKFQNIFSTNPKTEKSEHPTIILHLLPSDLSGKNVCPMAGNCRAICLNFAGNPAYLNTKLQARKRKTIAYFADREHFMQTLILGILDAFSKNNGEKIAVRLNGTSDILWENVPVYIPSSLANYISARFGFNVCGWDFSSIFEFFRVNMRDPSLIAFYDYTKTPRDFRKCAELGYNLTFSFDGWSNVENVKNCLSALKAGLNIAAAFNLKKSADLPEYVDITALGLPENSLQKPVNFLPVYDGDLSDYRPGDPPGGHIVGLRFKLPHGANYTAQNVTDFCIA